MPRQSGPPTWSQHDAAVWTTCEILSALLAGEPQRLRGLATPFPPHLTDGEIVLAAGDFEILRHHPHAAAPPVPATIVVGSSPATVAAGAVLAGVARRRARRRASEHPGWTVDHVGTVWVSPAGLYLQSADGLHPWAWPSIDAVQVLEPGAIHVQGRGQNSQISWVLRSDWAELVFTLWALTQHPAHPQLSHGAWQPAGWQERCRSRGLVPA